MAEGRDLHMLGYFIDTSSPGLREFLQRQRADRVRRIVEMAIVSPSSACPSIPRRFSRTRIAGAALARPQVASALLAAGHVETRDDAFRRFLEFGGPAYVPREGASPEDVIAVIHESNGLASVAHPGVSIAITCCRGWRSRGWMRSKCAIRTTTRRRNDTIGNSRASWAFA